jgi:hypothetical protein
MALVKCPGCSGKYKTGSSLSAHQRRCAGLRAKAKELFKKRGDKRKQDDNAKISCQENVQDDDVFQIRADLREHLSPFGTEEIHDGKRKLAGQKPVSVCVHGTQIILAIKIPYTDEWTTDFDNSNSPAIPGRITSGTSLYSGR